MESLTGLFIFGLCSGLYEATERIWEKSLDATWPLADAALKARFTRWTGQDKEAERQGAFAEADEIARANTLRQIEDPAMVKRIFEALNGERDPEGVEALAKEAAKLMLFSLRPDVSRLIDICRENLHWDAIWPKDDSPGEEIVAAVLSAYLTNLREALLDQPVYQHLVQEDMRRTLRKVLQEPPPVPYDEAEYRDQMGAMCRTLDFVGVPTLEEVFLPLRIGGLEVGEALQESDRLVILGAPGAGKTTLLRHLSLLCAEGRAEEALGLAIDGAVSPLPIFASLREFAAERVRRHSDYSLLEYLCTHAREHLMLALQPSFFESALEAGHCLVCLDGLDEVGAMGERKRVVDALRSLASRFPRNRYIVTSRVVGYEAARLDPRDFVHHQIMPLGDEDVREFVQTWYKADERMTDDLIETIEKDGRIQAVARNPLLLTVIALTHRMVADLSQERIKLYDTCVTTLTKSWEKAKGLPIAEERRRFYFYRRRLLERLAYDLHAQAEEPGELGAIKVGDLTVLLTRSLMENYGLGEDAWDEAQAFIRWVQGRTGLLMDATQDRDAFSFSHLAFQEYLTACEIEKCCVRDGVDGIWKKIGEHLTDPHWWEVILLLLGRLSSRYEKLPDLLVERILQAGEQDTFEPVLHRHLYLAACALVDRVDVNDGLHRKIVVGLLEAAREAAHWEERSDAFTALSRLKSDAYAAEGLLTLARDEQTDWTVRRDAAYALGELGYAGEAGDILLALARDEHVDWRVRRDAAIALGKLGHAEDRVLDGLLALALGEGVDAWVRRDAAIALGKLGRADDRVLDGLLALVRNEHVDAMARCDAASALGELGRAESWMLSGLLALARDEEAKPLVRSTAASALGKLGRIEEAAEVLLALTRDRRVDDWVRSAAASALGELGYAEGQVLDGLLELAYDDWVDWQVRRDAVQVLGDLRQAEDRVLEGLLALTRDESVDSLVRRDAAFALGKLGRPEASEDILLALARDEGVDAMVRRAAASRLGELGRYEEAEDVLLELICAEHVASLVRREAAIALGAVPKWPDATRGELGRVREKRVEVLLALARDEQVDSLVRRAVATVLGRRPVGGAATADDLRRVEEAKDILLAIAQDEKVDVMVRREAATALGGLGHAEQAGDILLAMAQNEQEDIMVRRKAAAALGDLGRVEQAGEILLALAQDEQAASGTRRAACQSLRRLMGSPVA